jgi:hypothetical protein
MNLSDELQDLAESLAGAGWQTKPEAGWTPDEHRAYHHWAKREIERQDAEAKARGEKIRVDVTMATEQDEYDRKTSIGAFLRPTRLTLNFTEDTMTQYSANQTVIRHYPGIDVEQVRMYHYYAYNRQQFLPHYHKRSNVETDFSMIKGKFGDAVRGKSDTAQINEVLCKVLCHNICVLVQSIHELGIEPTFGAVAQTA